jgi:hypothetical protein
MTTLVANASAGDTGSSAVALDIGVLRGELVPVDAVSLLSLETALVILTVSDRFQMFGSDAARGAA